ncbi:MAG: class I SAM-dependent methyltransferase [Actinobacteria bacterium]|nr:class I SAM-dependent methyltransferase [Actinomycetota bacterium]MBU1943504.1 class I SAM-dependent methyltransferase [Actinomycetota bacterium]MBU2686214.1 class I SAM-dependent methyltransferase [Actinomycetota bacterium]
MPEEKPEARIYDRIAWRYDLLETPMEKMFFSRLRKELLSDLRGSVLEVGVGTGKNLPYYPPGVELTGIDISPRMLERASGRAGALGLEADLRVMDVEELEFDDQTFDFIVVTFVFCSTTDPVKGLRELGRVLKDAGTILMLEHVRSENRCLGALMDLFNPLVRRLFGPNINRRTEENVRAAGLEIVSTEKRGTEILRKIVARRAANPEKLV